MINVKQLIQEFKDGKKPHRELIGASICKISRDQDGDIAQGLTNSTECNNTPLNQEVLFVIHTSSSSNGKGKTGKEIAIKKVIMASRSPYFRDLISNLDQEKIVRILLPKWVKPDFFQTFIDYLTLEDEGKITEALALFMNLTLDSAQRLLWLGDFFQILDIQRFLILEVILPKMTPEHVLNYLGDAIKKLKNASYRHSNNIVDETHSDPDLELWYHFHTSLYAFVGQNLPLILQTERSKKALIEMAGAEQVSNLIITYLKDHPLYESAYLLQEYLVQDVQKGIIFTSSLPPPARSQKPPTSCIRAPEDVKQLLWDLSFNTAPLLQHERSTHRQELPPQQLIVQEKHSHHFELFDTQYLCMIKARLDSDGALTISFSQLKKKKTTVDQAQEHYQASVSVATAAGNGLNSRNSIQKVGGRTAAVVMSRDGGRAASLNKQKRDVAAMAQTLQPRKKRCQSLCSPKTTSIGTMKFSMKDIQSKYHQMIMTVQQKLMQQSRRYSIGSSSTHNSLQGRRTFSALSSPPSTAPHNHFFPSSSMRKVSGARPLGKVNEVHRRVDSRNLASNVTATGGGNSGSGNTRSFHHQRYFSQGGGTKKTQDNDDRHNQREKQKDSLSEMRKDTPDIEALVVSLRVRTYSGSFDTQYQENVLVLSNQLLSQQASDYSTTQVLQRCMVPRDLWCSDKISHELSFKFYVTIERSLKEQLCLDYVIGRPSLILSKVDLLRQLSIPQLGCVMMAKLSHGKHHESQLEDKKIQILEAIMNPENMNDVEELILPLINFDLLSTQAIIDVIKTNQTPKGPTMSPKTPSQSIASSILAQSVAFKQQFKLQLRMRKEAQLYTNNNSTPHWGRHSRHASNYKGAGDYNVTRYASPVSSEGKRSASQGMYCGRSPKSQKSLGGGGSSVEKKSNGSSSCGLMAPKQRHCPFKNVPNELQLRLKPLEMSQKIANSILNSPITYGAQKRTSILFESPRHYLPMGVQPPPRRTANTQLLSPVVLSSSTNQVSLNQSTSHCFSSAQGIAAGNSVCTESLPKKNFSSHQQAHTRLVPTLNMAALRGVGEAAHQQTPSLEHHMRSLNSTNAGGYFTSTEVFGSPDYQHHHHQHSASQHHNNSQIYWLNNFNQQPSRLSANTPDSCAGGSSSTNHKKNGSGSSWTDIRLSSNQLVRMPQPLPPPPFILSPSTQPHDKHIAPRVAAEHGGRNGMKSNNYNNTRQYLLPMVTSPSGSYPNAKLQLVSQKTQLDNKNQRRPQTASNHQSSHPIVNGLNSNGSTTPKTSQRAKSLKGQENCQKGGREAKSAGSGQNQMKSKKSPSPKIVFGDENSNNHQPFKAKFTQQNLNHKGVENVGLKAGSSRQLWQGQTLIQPIRSPLGENIQFKHQNLPYSPQEQSRIQSYPISGNQFFIDLKALSKKLQEDIDMHNNQQRISDGTPTTTFNFNPLQNSTGFVFPEQQSVSGVGIYTKTDELMINTESQKNQDQQQQYGVVVGMRKPAEGPVNRKQQHIIIVNKKNHVRQRDATVNIFGAYNPEGVGEEHTKTHQII